MSFFEHVRNHSTHTHHDNGNTYTYADCVTGHVPVPHDYLEGSLYKLLMASCMTICMVTFNTVIHEGFAAVYGSLWLYPLILCLTLSLRFLFADRLVDHIVPRYILPRCEGFSRVVATTLLNTTIMAPTMGLITSLLLAGPDGCFERIANTLPYSVPTSVFVSLFIVGPLVKATCHTLLTTPLGTNVFRFTQRYVTTWAGVFTS